MTASPPPAHATPRDPHARSFGPAVGRLAAALGMPLMPWQRTVADTALEVDEHGTYRYSVVVLTVPRQSGKTSLLRPVMAHRALTVPRGRVWLTAQLRQDARDTWGETADQFEASALARAVRRRNTNGSETITFTPTGATIRPFNAGDERSLHGKQSDLVFVDEVFAFSRELGRTILQAVIPTQATRPGAQTWLVSTAGTAASTWLRDYVDRGRREVAEGVRSRLAYFEWGIPADTADLTDLDVYARHHPALGHTIGRPALETAYETLSPSEFARAYGNFWTSSDEWVIDPALWERARTHLPLVGRVAFAAEVAADRSHGVIVAAGRLADGRVAVEHIERRGGTGWMAPRLIQLTRDKRPYAVVIDPVSPAGAVHKQLTEQRELWVPLVEFDTSDLVAAQTELLDGIVAGKWLHRAHDELDAAVAAVGVRKLRETDVFAREVAEDGTSPAAVIAAMLASYGLAHPPPDQTPRLVVAAS